MRVYKTLISPRSREFLVDAAIDLAQRAIDNCEADPSPGRFFYQRNRMILVHGDAEYPVEVAMQVDRKDGCAIACLADEVPPVTEEQKQSSIKPFGHSDEEWATNKTVLRGGPTRN